MSTAVASTAVESGVLVSVGLVSVAVAATAEEGALPVSPYDPSGDVADDDELAGVVDAGGGVVAGGGVSWNEVGSMPTLLVTIGVVPAADVLPSVNDDGSMPTELVTTGGGVGVAAFAGEESATGID